MTEFISRKYGNEGYEVIIKTDCHEHYQASEEFARRLIDHEKPVTDNNVSGKWIPLSEGYPDLIPCNAGTAYSEAVIVWTLGKKAMLAVWDGIDFLCAAEYWGAEGDTVTHWMPLPEPRRRKHNATGNSESGAVIIFR